MSDLRGIFWYHQNRPACPTSFVYTRALPGVETEEITKESLIAIPD